MYSVTFILKNKAKYQFVKQAYIAYFGFAIEEHDMSWIVDSRAKHDHWMKKGMASLRKIKYR